MSWWRIESVETGLEKEPVKPGIGHIENYHIGTFPEKVVIFSVEKMCVYMSIDTHELPDFCEKDEITDFFVELKDFDAFKDISEKRKTNLRTWARSKLIMKYKQIWKRSPYKEEVRAAFNFVLNPIFSEERSGTD